MPEANDLTVRAKWRQTAGADPSTGPEFPSTIDNPPREGSPQAYGTKAATDVAGTTKVQPLGAARGGFTILKKHAGGGMGQISVARDEKLRRLVALKALPVTPPSIRSGKPLRAWVA